MIWDSFNFNSICVNVLSILSLFFPKKKNRITIIQKSFSGSNVTPLYNKLIKNHPNLEVILINTTYHNKSRNLLSLINQGIKHLGLLRSRIIVTTHGPIIRTKFRSKKQTMIELWHGFPTKKAGLLLGNKTTLNFVDYIISYSNFCTILQNARFGLSIDKYVTLGAPRNDYLFEKPENPFKSGNKKMIFYAPTWEQSINRSSLNFGINTFDLMKFDNFLSQNNFLLIWKVHPNDDQCPWQKNLQDKQSNFYILNDQQLSKWELDFYQLLPMSDLLITDYSSVYADYLLLDKPIIFIDHKSGTPNQDRNILLMPYEKWMPGPIVNDQMMLENEILNCLNDRDYYYEKRERIKHTFHRYCDGFSTCRVIDFILNILEDTH